MRNTIIFDFKIDNKSALLLLQNTKGTGDQQRTHFIKIYKRTRTAMCMWYIFFSAV